MLGHFVAGIDWLFLLVPFQLSRIDQALPGCAGRGRRNLKIRAGAKRIEDQERATGAAITFCVHVRRARICKQQSCATCRLLPQLGRDVATLRRQSDGVRRG